MLPGHDIGQSVDVQAVQDGPAGSGLHVSGRPAPEADHVRQWHVLIRSAHLCDTQQWEDGHTGRAQHGHVLQADWTGSKPNQRLFIKFTKANYML